MANGIVTRTAARMLERRHVTRSGVTRVSILVAVMAAVWFSRADLTGALLGSFFLALVLFCDAIRSRMRAHRRDALTLWAVSMAVRFREYVVYVGLAFGAVAAGHVSAWGWAAGALIALALRDSLSVARSSPPARSSVRPLPLPVQRRPEGGGGVRVPMPRDGGGGRADGAGAAVTRTEAPDVVDTPADAPNRSPWVRRLMAFDQPFRFLVIAVAVTAWDARLAFVSLIIGCAVAITGELIDPVSRGERR